MVSRNPSTQPASRSKVGCQVLPHLLFPEGEHQQGQVVLAAQAVAARTGEVGDLLANRAEVLGAAGEQHLRTRSHVEGPPQLPGEQLLVVRVQVDEHLVEPVEHDYRVTLVQPLTDDVGGQPGSRDVRGPVGVEHAVQDVVERHRCGQAGDPDVAQVEQDR